MTTTARHRSCSPPSLAPPPLQSPPSTARHQEVENIMESANMEFDRTQSDMLGCPEFSKYTITRIGRVVGRLSYKNHGHLVDCSAAGIGGILVPLDINKVSEISSDKALFILLVWRQDVFTKLAMSRFYDQLPCIIVNTRRKTDVGTRLFVRLLNMELKLPVLALFDCDPYALEILSFYGCEWLYGGKSYTLDVKWLGLKPSDLDKYRIPENCRLRMTKDDIKTCRRMLKGDFVKNHPDWVDEVRLMVQSKQKAEVLAFSAVGFRFITDAYLPRKIKDGGWGVDFGSLDVKDLMDDFLFEV